VGFNNKAVSHSYWDEDQTRIKMENDQKKKIKETTPTYTPSNIETTYKTSKKYPYYSKNEEEEFMKLAIEESLRTAKLEEKARVPSKEEKREERIIPRKDIKI
jgi:hypothetical protein